MKRVPTWAKRHPILTNLFIVMIVFSVGFWRVEHLYSCAQEYAEETTAANQPVRQAAADLQEADDKGWAAIDRVLRQQPGAIPDLRKAAAEHRKLSEDLQQTRKENPIPEPPGTFC